MRDSACHDIFVGGRRDDSKEQLLRRLPSRCKLRHLLTKKIYIGLVDWDGRRLLIEKIL